MKFIYQDLGHLSRGDQVEYTLRGSSANVRLMTSTNFTKYKAGKNYDHYGGIAKKSPVTMGIPSSGHWYAVVDMAGLRGNGNASIRVIPKPKKPLQNRSPSVLNDLFRSAPIEPRSDAVADTTKKLDTYDIFISHASEDKDMVARPLAEALQKTGLNVWYDELVLKIGDSLREKIAEGINNSRFAVLILSEFYLSKGWPKHELNGVMSQKMAGKQVVLPVWHGLTKQQVVDFDPGLSDTLARSTSQYTVEEIAAEIASVVLDIEGV
jgi:hypothetical protein